MDEREAFEAFKAANDLEDHEGTAWLAWQKRAALAATQASSEPVGEIAQDDILGWHFKPYKHWLDIGYGKKLYAAPVLETATQTPEPEETPVELWHGDRKVSIYKDIVLRVWGPNIETEMSDEPRTLQSVCDAVDWLYAAPESRVASKEG